MKGIRVGVCFNSLYTLVAQVKRYHQQVRRSMREMSFSDPEHLQRAGITYSAMGVETDGRLRQNAHIHHVGYDQHVHHPAGIPRLPPKLLRRQHTWHDVSALTRDVDVIEQITTSV